MKKVSILILISLFFIFSCGKKEEVKTERAVEEKAEEVIPPGVKPTQVLKHYVDKETDFSFDYPDLPGWIIQKPPAVNPPARIAFLNREARATLVLGFIQLPNVVDLSNPKIYSAALDEIVSSMKSSAPDFVLLSASLVTNPSNGVKGIQLIYSNKVMSHDWKGRHIAYFKGSKRYDITAYAENERFDAADRDFFTPVAKSFTFPAVK